MPYTYLVTVIPQSSENRVLVISKTELKVKVTAPAIDGRANTAMVEALHEHFGVPRSRIEILRGNRSRKKVVCIHD